MVAWPRPSQIPSGCASVYPFVALPGRRFLSSYSRCRTSGRMMTATRFWWVRSAPRRSLCVSLLPAIGQV